MGTRIHKKLGWGLTDLKLNDEGQLDDPRINNQALEGTYDGVGPGYLHYLETLREAEGTAYQEWSELWMVIQTASDVLNKSNQVTPWPLIHEPESGRPDVLLVQPIGFPKWSRHDDPIDYAEECALHEAMESRIVALPNGIHPFSHTLMDRRNGRLMDDGAYRLIRRMLDHPRIDTDSKVRAAADHLAKASKFNSADHAIENLVPAVPADIRHVCSWTGIFTAPDVWLQLRPMLYTYWA